VSDAPAATEISVRAATPKDWPAVAALLAELGRPPALGTDEEADLREVFERYLERHDAAAMVAEAGGEVVGFCDLEFRVRLNFAAPQGWIPDLVVSERSRSRGVGSALLARAEELAQERGCWGLSLESATWRERAHAFYLREGWTDSGKSFIKPLIDIQWPPAPR
jgi:GNAT superfamily N-acetyltransferase